jgi:O-antigen ligase
MINRHFFLSGNVISYLIICLPLALISGPFVPDIFITISSLFLLLQIYYNLKIFNLKNNIKIFIILFYIYLLLNLFITKSYNYSISASIFFLRFILLVFVIEYFCINSNKFKIYFFYILFFSLLIVILDGYFQFFFKQNILGFQQYCVRDCNENEELRSMRLTGLLNKPIIGSYIARLIPLLFGLFFLLKLKKINRFKDLFIVILSILATGLVFLSGERTSFALILGFFLIVLFITNYSRKFKFFISTGIIFIIFLTTIFSESTKFRMVTFTFMQVGIKVEKYSFFNDSNYKKFILVRDSMIKSEDNKLFIFSNHHHSHISTAFLIFKDNLVFGTGMKSFRYVCKKYRINDDSCTTHPHNLVLQFLSELGIIGFLFYLVSFIFFGLFLIKKIIQKNINNIQNAQICFGAGIFMSLFPLIPSGNFFNNWLSIIFYLTLGFFIYTRIEEKNG